MSVYDIVICKLNVFKEKINYLNFFNCFAVERFATSMSCNDHVTIMYDHGNIRILDRGSIRSSPRYGSSPPARLTMEQLWELRLGTTLWIGTQLTQQSVGVVQPGVGVAQPSVGVAQPGVGVP